MELSPSCGAANCVATQELLTCDWKVHLRVHRSLPLVPILSQIHPVHTAPSYLHPCLLLPSCLFLSCLLFRLLGSATNPFVQITKFLPTETRESAHNKLKSSELLPIWGSNINMAFLQYSSLRLKTIHNGVSERSRSLRSIIFVRQIL
jgi:hypothetical protein